MKAISIKQPWASLIVEGIKDIENRTWPTKFRGRVLVHAASIPWRFKMFVLYLRQKIPLVYKLFPDIESSWIAKIPMGKIIGSVEIVDCVINHPSIWAEKSIDCKDGCPDVERCPIGKCPHRTYNWVLANPVKFAKPIPAKGKLSFWDYPMTEEEYFNLEKISL